MLIQQPGIMTRNGLRKQAILEASEEGNPKVVKLSDNLVKIIRRPLLSDERVNPSAGNNKTIISSSREGRVEVVKLSDNLVKITRRS